MQTYEFQGKTYAAKQVPGSPEIIGLSTLETKDLLTIHNLSKENVGGKGTKRFSDRSSALKRTEKALAAYVEYFADEGDDMDTTDKTPTPHTKPKKEGKKRGMRFVFPASDEIKSVKSGTMRATLLKKLRHPKGATFEELVEATWGQKRGEKGWSEEKIVKTTYEATRLIHYFTGYGMYQDEDGRIHAFTQEERTNGNDGVAKQ